MRIAICCINKSLSIQIKSAIYRYAEQYKLDIIVDFYTSGEVFLKYDASNYQLIFLGYELAGINGFETAKILRNRNISTAIIFISACIDFIFDSFKVNPYRFLVAPTNETQIYMVLDEFFKKCGGNYPLWIKIGGDTFCINTDDIYYLEAQNKHCEVHLEDKTIPCNRTMARFYSVLPKNHFSKINRAFIVNLNHIAQYNRDTVLLKNGKILYTSRNYYNEFKKEYRLFSKPVEL